MLWLAENVLYSILVILTREVLRVFTQCASLQGKALVDVWTLTFVRGNSLELQKKLYATLLPFVTMSLTSKFTAVMLYFSFDRYGGAKEPHHGGFSFIILKLQPIIIKLFESTACVNYPYHSL